MDSYVFRLDSRETEGSDPMTDDDEDDDDDYEDDDDLISSRLSSSFHSHRPPSLFHPLFFRAHTGVCFRVYRVV